MICYRSEKHQQCSESFYKECVLEEVAQQKFDDQKKHDVIEMLQRLEQSEESAEDEELFEEEMDSDDEAENEIDLADRLMNVDLNDADGIWDKLTEAEKQEFKSIVYNGEINQIVNIVEPYWTLKIVTKLVRPVDEVEDDTKAIYQKFPKIYDKIKDFSKISKVDPNKCIIFNLMNVLGAYTYIFRYYNGDHFDYAEEAANNLISISTNLNSNAIFESAELAIQSITMECLNSGLYSDDNTKDLILSDVKLIFQGPGNLTNRTDLILAVISDLYNLLKFVKNMKKHTKLDDGKEGIEEAESSTKQKFNSDFNDGKADCKWLEDLGKMNGFLRKIEYYLSFVKFKFQTFEVETL